VATRQATPRDRVQSRPGAAVPQLIVPDFIQPHHGSIYVGGPMRGYDRYNFGAFDAASERLRTLGWDVRSPAEHDIRIGFDPDTGLESQDYSLEGAFRWDVATLAVCNAIYLLRGWRKSKGATVEHSIAEACGLVIIFEESDEFPTIENYLEVA
jgi:hypothetical protein